MSGERGLAEEVATDAAAMQCVAAVQSLEAKVSLIKAFATRRRATQALMAAAAGLVGEHHMITAT